MNFQDRPIIRFVNSVVGGLSKLGITNVDFQPAAVERMARRVTRLDDFGDERYREPLEILCRSYRNDDRLTPIGKSICFFMLVHILKNRAWLQRDIQQHPEILQTPVRKPLFVIGLPRTGTTLLYNLLSQDTNSRALMYWESMQPSPPPTPETYNTDPRIAQAKRQTQQLMRALPQMHAIHEFRHDVPEECLGLLLNTFVCPFFRARIPEYRNWLLNIPDSEIDAAYLEYRSQLQVLQWKVNADHWVLKCPAHLYGLGGLLSAFPDGAVVQTHRNLSKTIPSFCSLTSEFEKLIYRDSDREECGQRVIDTLRMMLDRGLAGRDRVQDARVLDIRFENLVQNPIETVRKIYQHFGYEYTDDFDQRLRQYRENDTHAKQKQHQYTLADFGLSTDFLDARFRDYADRFQVQLDRASAT